MTSTLIRTRPARALDDGDLRLAPRGRQRRPLLAVASVVLVVACVAVFASLYVRAGHQVSVLAMARPVEQGQSLVASDLEIVRISLSPGVLAVPAGSADTVLGRRVAVPLEPGTLLVPADLSGGPSVPPGDAIVGVALKPSQLPAAGVASGDDVDVVMTGVPGSPYGASGLASGPSISGAVSGPGTILAPGAQVSEVSLPSPSSGSDVVVVSLIVPRALAPIIASASAAGQAALVVVTSGP